MYILEFAFSKNIL